MSKAKPNAVDELIALDKERKALLKQATALAAKTKAAVARLDKENLSDTQWRRLQKITPPKPQTQVIGLTVSRGGE